MMLHKLYLVLRGVQIYLSTTLTQCARLSEILGDRAVAFEAPILNPEGPTFCMLKNTPLETLEG